MTSPGGNVVEIRVVVRDQSAPGFDAVTARAKRTAQAMAGGPGSVAGSMKEAEKQASGLGGTLRRVGEVAGGVLVADVVQQMAQRAVQLVHSTAQAASTLNESVNAVNQTFGDGAEDILAWGEANANAIGLSRAAFQQSATVVGAMLKNQGLDMEDVTEHTTRLTERAADMASVFNTDVSDALAAIQAGLRGEIDPLERYGVSLSAAAVEQRALAISGKTATRELTTQDKALARLAVLYEQTEQVAGDFRNTSDGMANAQRIATAQIEDAKAKIGTAFMPVLAKASQLTGALAGGFAALPVPVTVATVAIIGMGAAIGLLGPRIVAARAALATLPPMMRAVTVAAGPLAIALAAVGVAYSMMGDDGNVRKLKSLAEATDEVGEVAAEVAKSVDELADEYDNLIDNAFALEEAQDRAAGAIADLREQVEENGAALTGNSEAARENRESVRGLVETYKELMIEAARSGQSTAGLAQELEEQLVAMGFARDEAHRYVLSLLDLQRELAKIQSKTIEITIIENKRRGTGYQMAHGGITGAAGGGPRSNQTLVGEHGPEIVDLAPGSMVHSNPDTMRMLSQAAEPAPAGPLQIVFSGDTDSAFATAFMKLVRNGQITIKSSAIQG